MGKEMFLAWQKHDADGIITTLAEGRRDGILLIYTLQTENVMPMELYEVGWSLLRRGKNRFSTTLGRAYYGNF